MSYRNIKNIIFVFSILLFSAVLYSKADALTPIANLSAIGVCGNDNTSNSLFVNNLPSSGVLFMSLSNNQETNTSSTVYAQSIKNLSCDEIGQAKTQYGSWSKVGNFNNKDNQFGAIIVNGTGLGALPYQPVAKIMIITNPKYCTYPKCLINYHGFKASIQPVQLSNATDNLAVDEILPVNNVVIKNVSYYSDSSFLYESKSLKPLNKNYLAGGVHNTLIQVSLKNGEVLNINQTVNMGVDYTGTLLIRSSIYKSHDKALVFILLGLVVLIIILIIWVIGLSRKHRQYKKNHGLDKPIDTHYEIKEDKTKFVIK